ncbi:hypothetical protein JL720_12133 [Aureococcus anophagefferens]|nr:hypothetical protein JL720_12133 [Aureococcus anophagefferens]
MLRFLALATAAVAFAPSARTSPRAFRLAAAEAGAAPAAGIQFYEGMFEPDVPDVKITRSRDGDNGVATFDFQAPSFFNCERGGRALRAAAPTAGAITAMTMMDEEGELSTPNVNARFVDGDPVGLVVRYEMTTPAARRRA